METNRLNPGESDDSKPLFADIALRAAIRKTFRDSGAQELDTKQLACVEAFVKANCQPAKARPNRHGVTIYFSLEAERDQFLNAVKDSFPESEIEKG